MPRGRTARVLIDIMTGPGVVLHELAHWAAADILGADVERVTLFQLSEPGDPTGAVVYQLPAAYWRRVAISFAPIVVNTVFAVAILTTVRPALMAPWTLGAWYLALVLLVRALPSQLDIDTLWPQSTPGFLHPLFLVTLPVIGGFTIANRLPSLPVQAGYAGGVIALLAWGHAFGI